MERRLRRTFLADLLRFQPASRCDGGRRRERDFALALVLIGVVGAVCQIVGAVIEVGRSAGWWQ